MDGDGHFDELTSVDNSASAAENSGAQDLVGENLDEENNLEDEKLCQTEEDSVQPEDLVESKPTVQVNFELAETAAFSEETKGLNSGVLAENGSLALEGGSPDRSLKIDANSLSGAKRARSTVDENQPSVHFMYNSLTRASRQKLEELLQQWSEWHAKHVSSSNDPIEVLESGDGTFFPALHVGLEKTSAVSFWMDNQTRKHKDTEFIPLDGNSVPLYDRGYALGLTSADGSSNVDSALEIIDDAARCFNCGSYNHSLKECQRPRDNAAVNIARKQHKSKRNQNAAFRNPTRYYQNSPAGKYDGLRPGALDATTRQLLGLGELDPPPWLNRMREIGYPPGYLDVDDEDQPSGITIYNDREITEQEDGEIMEVDYPKLKRKKTVKFPGINAPIPENADERLWAAGAALSSSDISNSSRNRPPHRWNYSMDYVSRDSYREQRLSGDFRDDGPPGDPGYSTSTYSFHPRYGGYDINHSPHHSKENNSASRSPTTARSQLEWSSRSHSNDEGFLNPSSFHSLYYSTPERHLSPWDRDSGRHRDWMTESLNDRDRDRSSRYRDQSEDHRHHRWR